MRIRRMVSNLTGEVWFSAENVILYLHEAKRMVMKEVERRDHTEEEKKVFKATERIFDAMIDDLSEIKNQV